MMMTRRAETIAIGGFKVVNASAEPAARWLLNQVRRKEKRALFFANTNFVTKCRHLRDRMCDESVTIFNDGIGLDLAALMLHRHKFDDNLNGTDFLPYMFRRSSRPLRIFLLGGRPEVLPKATAFVEGRLAQQVVGSCDGYSLPGQGPKLEALINEARPDILLVALGNPLQEEWILDHFERLDISLAIGVGGLFDFWAGSKTRAPMMLRRCRMEWLFRLWLEPRRLSRRYTVEVAQFLMHCLKQEQEQEQEQQLKLK